MIQDAQLWSAVSVISYCSLQLFTLTNLAYEGWSDLLKTRAKAASAETEIPMSRFVLLNKGSSEQ
jgi:hypothetical protein